MTIEKDKRLCIQCGWQGDKSAVDFVLDPRPIDAGDGWEVCPQCRAAESIRVCCDEVGCMQVATCGLRLGGGYRIVCTDHYHALTKAGGT